MPLPKHHYRVGTEEFEGEPPVELAEVARHRTKIEPWLSAVFQSEQLSLLAGSGLTSAIAAQTKATSAEMSMAKFNCAFDAQIDEAAKASAESIGRGGPNVEDQLRSALALEAGLQVLQDARSNALNTAIGEVLKSLVTQTLASERGIADAIERGSSSGLQAKECLASFLMSFASRASSRERLNVFTTNYDRLIEYGCDLLGLRIIDRFVGVLRPVFRSSRLGVDLHYNPPGIRGEPRFLEGVIRLAKLHGSMDWRFEGREVVRWGLPFGAADSHSDLPQDGWAKTMIFPNAAKDVETTSYPYAELHRDFAGTICRPNSALVTYGYGFGDDHLNRVIRDMLTLPSTHLVVISYDDASGRIERFLDSAAKPQQVSMLIGPHFADMKNLTDHYLPRASLDQITFRMAELLERRGRRRDEGTGDAGAATEGTDDFAG